MLVAFVILALSLGVLLQIFSTGLRGMSAAETYTMASSLAQSRLASVGVTEPLAEGEATGELGGGFRWHTLVRPFPVDEGADELGLPVRAYEVVVTVHWDERGGERAVSLATLRLAPAQ